MSGITPLSKSGGWVLSNLWHPNAARCKVRVADTVRYLLGVAETPEIGYFSNMQIFALKKLRCWCLSNFFRSYSKKGDLTDGFSHRSVAKSCASGRLTICLRLLVKWAGLRTQLSYDMHQTIVSKLLPVQSSKTFWRNPPYHCRFSRFTPTNSIKLASWVLMYYL